MLKLLRYLLRILGCYHPGRTVWLGAQILSIYLYDLLGSKSAATRNGRRPRAVDLGSGTGLVALTLASMGYDSLATDVDLIVSGVLGENVAANRARLEGPVAADVLDWFSFDPETWSWRAGQDGPSNDELPIDLIATADTVYDAALSTPLLNCLHGLSLRSALFAPGHTSPPPCYVALEVRDPSLVAAFFDLAASAQFGFKCTRVDPDRIRKLVQTKEGTLGWEDDADWDGIEIWKLALSKRELARARAARKQAAAVPVAAGG